MTTQIFVASTAVGLATLAAAVEDELFPGAGRRLLVLSNNAVIPETGYGVADVAGMGPLIEAFDDVYSYNDVIAPQHPSDWQPRAADVPIWERSLRSLWALDGDLRLVVEGIVVYPALALCRAFVDAAIDVYAGGLTSYGPTHKRLPAQIGMRVERLLHLDLVPGVRPLLLREYGVPPLTISNESFRKVVAGVMADVGPAGLGRSGGPTAVLLGQDLSALHQLTDEEERQLYLQMVEDSVAAGFRDLIFKPSPGAPTGVSGQIVARAGDLGAQLTVREAPELVETWYASGEVDLVVGCSATALATAALYGVPAVWVGTELLLERLHPYENSNRMAATIVAATVPQLRSLAAGAAARSGRPRTLTTEQVVNTVSYLMQPARNQDLRDAAVKLLDQHAEDLRPYVRSSRLSQLGLLGDRSPTAPGRHRPDGPARLPWTRRVTKRILGPRLSRRLGKAVRRLLRHRR
jgi:hypothetical protein